jgi:hypothetical protein
MSKLTLLGLLPLAYLGLAAARGWPRPRGRWLFLLLAAIALAMLITAKSGYRPNLEVYEQMAAGDLLVDAIEDYHQKNGRYPAGLDVLGGTDAPAVTAFQYQSDAEAGYILSFFTDAKLYCTRAVDEGWRCGD